MPRCHSFQPRKAKGKTCPPELTELLVLYLFQYSNYLSPTNFDINPTNKINCKTRKYLPFLLWHAYNRNFRPTRFPDMQNFIYGINLSRMINTIEISPKPMTNINRKCLRKTFI
ncbi:hypothetical protein MA04_02732 [Alcanivorax balearicus MACL04]|uniref:Uncharacterized protein n=1 Tax=Alloalcanivorax balearicus MACL04 TaxID=1177182 RepID=A0ABT2R150_9GAMM|nr:hypothetical protein [Alloalcanivorax balearicus MACL04]